MEITPVARRRSISTRARTWLIVLVLAPVTLAVLVPTAIDLQRFVVAGDDLRTPYGRGALLLSRDVPVGDVEVGDVVTYAVDGRPAGRDATLVTRRVAAVTDGALVMSTDAQPGTPALAAQVDLSGRTVVCRAVLAVPVVGYLFLGPLDGLGWPLLLLVLGGGLGLLLALRRPRVRRPLHRGTHAAVAR